MKFINLHLVRALSITPISMFMLKNAKSVSKFIGACASTNYYSKLNTWTELSSSCRTTKALEAGVNAFCQKNSPEYWIRRFSNRHFKDRLCFKQISDVATFSMGKMTLCF